MSKLLGTATVMRHGATRYTEIFPDLAEEGLDDLRETIAQIAQRFPKRPVFMTSPAMRTRGTLTHIARAYYGEEWEHAYEHAILCDELRPVEFYKVEELKRILDNAMRGIADPLRVHHVVDRFYATDPEFEMGVLCEPRSSTLRRFRSFLPRLAHTCRPARHVVVVTHFELVGLFIHSLFPIDLHDARLYNGFRPAEAAHFTFFDDGTLEAEFRGKTMQLQYV